MLEKEYIEIINCTGLLLDIKKIIAFYVFNEDLGNNICDFGTLMRTVNGNIIDDNILLLQSIWKKYISIDLSLVNDCNLNELKNKLNEGLNIYENFDIYLATKYDYDCIIKNMGFRYSFYINLSKNQLDYLLSIGVRHYKDNIYKCWTHTLKNIENQPQYHEIFNYRLRNPLVFYKNGRDRIYEFITIQD